MEDVICKEGSSDPLYQEVDFLSAEEGHHGEGD